MVDLSTLFRILIYKLFGLNIQVRTNTKKIDGLNEILIGQENAKVGDAQSLSEPFSIDKD